jgi:hypothetical protein
MKVVPCRVASSAAPYRAGAAVRCRRPAAGDGVVAGTAVEDEADRSGRTVLALMVSLPSPPLTVSTSVSPRFRAGDGILRRQSVTVDRRALATTWIWSLPPVPVTVT